jgi:hypothetical protein
LRKKTAMIASLAALGFLAVSAGPVLADGMPPGMPDLEETLKARPAPAQPDPAHMQGMAHGKEQMHGQMMQGHRMAMRDRRTRTAPPACHTGRTVVADPAIIPSDDKVDGQDHGRFQPKPWSAVPTAGQSLFWPVSGRENQAGSHF